MFKGSRIVSEIALKKRGYNSASEMNDSSIPFGNTSKTDGTLLGPATWDDATWILTSSFIIFTMQSGKASHISHTMGNTVRNRRLLFFIRIEPRVGSRFRRG